MKRLLLKWPAIILIGFLLTGASAYATGLPRQIQVSTQPLRFFFDGVEKQAPAEAFTYNGETYVPARFVAEALGKGYTTDEANGLVWVGPKANDPSGTLMSDLRPVKQAGTWSMASSLQSAGRKQMPNAYVLTGGSGYIEFDLGGVYDHLSYDIFVPAAYADKGDGHEVGRIKVYLNGWERSNWSMAAADLQPKHVEIPVQGVQTLRIAFENPWNWELIGLSQVRLHKQADTYQAPAGTLLRDLNPSYATGTWYDVPAAVANGSGDLLRNNMVVSGGLFRRTYQLQGRYEKLAGTLYLPWYYARNGSQVATVTILVNGNKTWERTVTNSQMGKIPIDVQLNGAERVSIEVSLAWNWETVIFSELRVQ
ncbi:MAG TPA: stalk domain-containing protein [Symbiobacteriaceae bacterium]|nr:stalk domain-containing protein [Symbiobacteriaceae bacterium]